MAVRSAQNKRTVQKQTGDATGATRKGASRAKPAKGAATTVKTASKRTNANSKKATPLMSKLEKREARLQEKEKRNREIVVSEILIQQDDRYIFRKRIWWITTLLGFAFMVVAIVLMFTTPAWKISSTYNYPEKIALYVFMALAYVCVFGALIYEFVRIRPIRKNIEVVVSSTPPKRLQLVIDEDRARILEEREAKKAEKQAKKHMTKEEKLELKELHKKEKLAKKMYGKKYVKREKDKDEKTPQTTHEQRIQELVSDGMKKAEAVAKKKAAQKKRRKATGKKAAEKKTDTKKSADAKKPASTKKSAGTKKAAGAKKATASKKTSAK